MNTVISNQSGSIKPIINIIVVIAGLYAGFVFAMPHYRAHTMKSEAKAIAVLGLEESKTMALFLEKAAELNIPVKKENIKVSVDEKKVVTIRAQWKETINILGIYEDTLAFKLDVKQ
ncbi:MAG: hypothetical protein H7844_05730 [Nitrospirae bacterium YQR-1]